MRGLKQDRSARVWHGTIHGVNAIPCFLSLAIATFVFARRYFAQPGARN